MEGCSVELGQFPKEYLQSPELGNPARETGAQFCFSQKCQLRHEGTCMQPQHLGGKARKLGVLSNPGLH